LGRFSGWGGGSVVFSRLSCFRSFWGSPVAFAVLAAVPSFRVVVGRALRWCASWCVRFSRRSFSGRVVVVSFRSFAVAAAWARRFAPRCAVRRGPAGAFFVSVPVL